MKFTPLGDSALAVRVYEDFARNPGAALEAVTDALQCLELAAIPGVRECAPAYDSIALFFDPIVVVEAGAAPENILHWLQESIASALATAAGGRKEGAPSPLLEVPVCYEGEFAPDLSEVARHNDLSTEEIVRRHSGEEYRVHCIGFVPGFPFLGGLPAKLATPRRATPRKLVPAGSVGIGGAQTGIYPIRSPGGWNLIGRTPLRLFDARRQRPALLAAGDRVRFRPISPAEFSAWAE